ncbi:MAG: hypothetical protein H6625_10090 [Bdellovibrionaceae bacterium]|nr:hypothetical protein [Pseudobdellovibrionaceae bacterium]
MKIIYSRPKFGQFLFLGFILLNTSLGTHNFAEAKVELDCDSALEVQPLQNYMARAQEKVSQALKEAPHPSFVDPAEDAAIFRTGEELPLTLQVFISTQQGVKISALKTPSLNTEHPSAAARFIPSTGVSAHLELESEGKTITTQAYFNMPLLVSPDQLDTEYLFSPKKGHKVMIYHGHGGGTPMAESMNGSSVALHTVKHGIPFMAVDQHAHGKGPNAPLLSYDDKIEYNLKILAKTVHPDVKVILSGHSWGGEDLFYFWTQYYPKHKNGRFKQILSQIVGVMPLSPPADVAMGSGSARERVEIEERLFRELAKDPEYMNRIAENDKEFLQNVLRSGKSSLTALWHTLLTQIFLNIPIPAKEELKNLPKIKIYQGKWDGLVYVGREFAFKPWQDLLQENFVLMDRYDTQRESNVAQGHQTFDAIDANGKPVVYSGMIDMAQETTGQSFPEINFDAKGNFDAVTSLHRIFVQYMSFFPAREYYSQRKVLVPQDIPQGVQSIKLRLLLEKFSVGLAQLREENQKQAEEEMKKRILQLAKEYAIRGGDEEGAIQELRMHKPSPARLEHLNNYIAEANQVEKSLYHHRVFDADTNALAKVKKFSQKIEDEYKNLYEQKKAKLKEGVVLSEYEPLGITVWKIKELEDGRVNLSSLFKNKNKIPNYVVALDDVITKYNLKEFFKDIESITSTNMDEENIILAKIADQIIAVSNSFEGPAELVKERNSRIGKILQSIKESRTEYNRKTHTLVVEAISKIQPELGVKSIKDARWELNKDYSEERKKQLKEFIAKVNEARFQLKEKSNADIVKKVEDYQAQQLPLLNIKIAELNDSKESIIFKNEQDVTQKIAELREIEMQHYIPKGKSSAHEDLKLIVSNLKKYEAQQEQLRSKRDQFNQEYDIKDLLKHKNTLLRKLEELFVQSHVNDGPDKWPNEIMPRWWPKKIRKKVQAREESLEKWKKLEAAVSSEIYDYMLSKFEAHGRFYPDDFNNIPDSIRQKMKKFKTYRSKYFKKKQEVIAAFFKAMRKGEIPAPFTPNESEIPDFSKTSEHINTLIGKTDLKDSPIYFDPQSIEGKLRVAEKRLEDISSEEAKVKAQISLLKYKYNEVVRKIDPSLIVKEYIMVDVGNLLQMGMDDVLKQTQSPQGDLVAKGIHLALKDWEELWKDLVYETQVSNPELYPLNPQFLRTASGDEN